MRKADNALTDNLFEIAIPYELENMKLPSPELALWWENAQMRTFWIDTEIDQGLFDIGRRIIKANMEDQDIEPSVRSPIRLYIHSYGGDLDSTLGFLDICALSKTPIITINAGVAMSAGLLIMLAGHKRYCFQRSRALVHSGSGGFAGTFEQSEAAMADYKRAVEIMRQYILERSTVDEKLFARKKNKEWYLDSKEQVEHGFAHEILTDLDVLS